MNAKQRDPITDCIQSICTDPALVTRYELREKAVRRHVERLVGMLQAVPALSADEIMERAGKRNLLKGRVMEITVKRKENHDQ